MLINRNEIVCDECGKPIESFPKPRGWENPMTAEAHVCEGCWEKEFDRVLKGVDSWEGVTAAIKMVRFPIRTFVGRVLKEDDVVQKTLEKFGVSKTT